MPADLDVPDGGGVAADAKPAEDGRVVKTIEDDRLDHVTAELLPELGQEELEPEFDDEEHGEASEADNLARYLRREQDRVLYERLAAAGFEGAEYEIFRGELAAYALPVIRSWLRRELIFAYALRQGRPLKVTEYDRAGLQEVEERIGLAHETVARALALFHQRALTGAGWSHDGGAALTTYFVGACVAVFPGVFRRWHNARTRWNSAVDVSVKKIDPVGLHPQDPAEEVVSRERVLADLKRLPDELRAIAERVVWEGRGYAEIAAELDLTERSVEGRLYRHRTEHQRRHGQGGGTNER